MQDSPTQDRKRSKKEVVIPPSLCVTTHSDASQMSVIINNRRMINPFIINLSAFKIIPVIL